MIYKATLKDANKIQQLINYYAERGEMLPRAISEIYENIRDFFVCVETVKTGLTDKKVVGVAALHIGLDGMAEIRSVAIDPKYTRKGIGSLLAKECLREAKELGVKKVFVLTYKPQFFEKVGFRVIEKERLPQKVWGDCVRCVKFPVCDEIAMISEVREQVKVKVKVEKKRLSLQVFRGY